MTEIIPRQDAEVSGISSTTSARLAEVRDMLRTAGPDQLAEALIYTDAVATVARERRAHQIATEAAETRILAARRLGQLIIAASDDHRERIWDIVPGRFMRCDEVAKIPDKVFGRVTEKLLSAGGTCSIPTVIRRAQEATLVRVEDGIYSAHDGTFFVQATRGKKQQAVDLKDARRLLGIKQTATDDIDHAYSQARILANVLSRIKQKYSGGTAFQIGEAELAAMKAAESLHAALRSIGAV